MLEAPHIHYQGELFTVTEISATIKSAWQQQKPRCPPFEIFKYGLLVLLMCWRQRGALATEYSLLAPIDVSVKAGRARVPPVF